ncbi:alpha/beta hydrolase [Pelagibius sp. 7325]|uniref:alpha/beta fold hydrolase n=1 Tax=Pelagibius sp. 7325 TaxID=3131994 RepID=UPI0030EC53E2
MPHVEIAGARVAYRIDGNGPGLVLVHGTGGSAATSWTGMINRLAARWTVVRPDYAGSGGTVDGGGPLRLDALAAQVVAAAQHAGLASFHVLGFSLGAVVAVKIAADHPDKVLSVVPLGGMLSTAEPRVQLLLRLWSHLIAKDREAMVRHGLLTCFSPDYLARFDTAALERMVAEDLIGTNWEGLARQVELDLSLDVTSEAARVAVPALVLGCRHDQIVPPDIHARALAAAIPGAVYTELESGHCAPFEVPEALLDLVEPFLLRNG